jgi:hypothetical protein
MEIPNINSLNEFEKLKVLAAVILFLFGSGVYIGSHTSTENNLITSGEKIQPEMSYSDIVKQNVKAVDRDIQTIQESKGNVSLGRFRMTCQEAEQRINKKWVDAKNDNKYEHKNINKIYISYLVAASEVVQSYEIMGNPDTSKMKELSNNITIENKITPVSKRKSPG